MLKKKFNKLLLSVNTRIESFFNHIKIFINSKKKFKNLTTNIDKKIIIGISSIIILVLSFFFTPSFYDKDLVKIKLSKQLFEKYNLEVKFDGDIEYGIFPKPHFFIKKTIINYGQENLAQTDFAKIYIEINNFFSSKNIKIQDLFFRKTEFNINQNNYDFFKKILNFNKNKHGVYFKNSKLFYKDRNEDVVFLTNVKNLEFLYTEEFDQVLITDLKIFNTPLKIKIVNNGIDQKAHIDLNSYKLRMNIENHLDYSKGNKVGLLNVKAINKSKKINYTIKKNSLNFNSEKNNFNGSIDFKPFYFSLDLKLLQLDIFNIFKNTSILYDLLSSNLLNNENLSAVVNVNFDKIKKINYFKDIDLKIYFEEGDIFINDSTLSWKDSILINLDNVYLIMENNRPNFSGTISFNFKDIDDFYRQYQIKRIHRKKIEKIKLDFFLNIDEKIIELDNLKIDGASNKLVENFISNLNKKKKNLFNKIIFKNLIKELFSII